MLHELCTLPSCGRDAVAQAVVDCATDCPRHRTVNKQVSKFCRPHLKEALAGDLIMSACKSKLVAFSWEDLPGNEEPARAKDVAKRIGDADRGDLIGRLSDAYAGGYITVEEFNERNEQVYKVRTRAELDKLTADLDLPAAEQEKPKPKRVQHLNPLWLLATAIGTVFVIFLIAGMF